MDALALLAIPFLIAVGAHEATLAQQRHAAAAQYGQPYVYAIPPGSGWAPGAAIGAGVGALASAGHAGPALAGALIGGAIGHAASTPAVYVAPGAYAAPAYSPPAAVHSTPASLAATEAFTARWQQFMEPSARRQ